MELANQCGKNGASADYGFLAPMHCLLAAKSA
jgi:hypothetical protein